VKRLAFTIALFLLLGASLNIAITWTCAVLIPSESRSNDACPIVPSRPDAPRWRFYRQQQAAALRIVSWPEYHGIVDTDFDLLPITVDDLPGWSRPRQRPPKRPDGTTQLSAGYARHDTIAEDARGWPFLSLRCTLELQSDPARRNMFAVGVRRGIAIAGIHTVGLPPAATGAIPIRPDFWSARALPLHPIWPGFLTNTFVYAAAGLLSIRGPLAVRTYLRLRRNECPACGYPRGIAHTCPECGHRHRRTGDQGTEASGRG